MTRHAHSETNENDDGKISPNIAIDRPSTVIGFVFSYNAQGAVAPTCTQGANGIKYPHFADLVE